MCRTGPGRHGAPVLVVDVRPGGTPLGSRLSSSHSVSSVGALPQRGESASAGLAIGIYCGSGWATRFAAWAQSVAVPVLTVAMGARSAFVGPLTIPGRVGCGRCAYERIVAAGADTQRDGGPVADGDERDMTELVSQVIDDELARILASGVGCSRLVDTVVVVDAQAGMTTDHRVIPLARCPVCGGAATLTERSDRRPPAVPPTAGAAGVLAGWVDPLTGIIPALVLDPQSNESRSLPIVLTAEPPQIVDHDGSLRRLPVGWGKGLTPGDAIRSAVGEALERYCASLPDPEQIIWRRPEELEGDRLDPRMFNFYSDEQYARENFPYVRFDPDVKHPWARGRWLGDGSDVWVPAVLCYLSLTVGPENLICQGTSNGLAASTNPHDAALRATLELIERDALMTTWLTRDHGQRLRVDDSLDPSLTGVLDHIEQQGASVELYLLPSVCGVTAVCLALGDGKTWPGVTIGLAADLEPGAAVRGAIVELGQTGPYLRRLMQSGAPPVPSNPDAVRDMLEHAVFYFLPERAEAFTSLRAGRHTVSHSSLVGWGGDRSLESCAAALEAARIRVALVDVTSPDVATGPFRVVRAVSPDLQPISYGHGLDREPVERIRRRVRADEVPPIHPIW